LEQPSPYCRYFDMVTTHLESRTSKALVLLQRLRLYYVEGDLKCSEGRGAICPTIRPLENRLSSVLLRSSGKFTTLYIFRTAHARGVFFSVRSGAVVSQDHSAVSVSTVRLGVQFRQPKAASPPQELEVRAAGGRANFYWF
jgi:hypothetical protein